MKGQKAANRDGTSRRKFLSLLGMSPAVYSSMAVSSTRNALAPRPAQSWEFRMPGNSEAVVQSVTGETVLAATLEGRLSAISTDDSDERWYISTDGNEPLVVPETVAEGPICATDETGRVYALDRRNGNEVWDHYEAASESRVFVTKADEDVFIMGDALVVRSHADGSKRWSIEPDEDLHPDPTVVGTVVCVGTWNDEVIAYDTEDGMEVWRFSREETDGGRAELYPVGRSAPGTTDDGDNSAEVVVLVWDRMQKRLIGVDANEGVERWQFDLPDVDFTLKGAHTEEATYAFDGKDLVAIETASGAERWRFDADETLTHEPVVGENAVYVSGEASVYSLSSDDGSVRWTVSLDEDGRDGALLGSELDDEFVFDDRTGSTRAISIEDGSLRWVFEHGSQVEFGPQVGDDAVFIGTEDGVVHALESPSGSTTNKIRQELASADASILGGGLLAGGVVGTGLLAAGISRFHSSDDCSERTE